MIQNNMAAIAAKAATASLRDVPFTARQPVPVSKVDFQREVYCILGLPVDAISFDSVSERIRYAAMNRKRCFLSTANLNFMISCLDDEAFRQSVLLSDLSVTDGMPIVWIARLMKLPIRERISGSSLISAMREHPGPAVPLYFFGGQEGVAHLASEKIGDAEHGLRSAGYHAPGFGSLDDISSSAILEEINCSNAGILSVSIGGQRGQVWLMKNAHRLVPPVIANLGATINFVAGKVKRAPVWMQKTGLEWMWRIKEEPALWRRYWHDAAGLVRILFKSILPCAMDARYTPTQAERAGTSHRVTRKGNHITIELNGAWAHDALSPLRTTLREIGDAGGLAGPVTLNFKKTSYVDSGMLGLLILLYAHQLRQAQPLKLINVRRSVARIFRHHHASYLLGSGDGR